MRKFRKKPVVIEAQQWFQNGDIIPYDQYDPEGHGGFEGKCVRRFRHPDIPGMNICSQCNHYYHDHGWVDTLEGGHTVCPGDWIIKGIKGEFYPCKPDVFKNSYEAVE